MKKAVCALIFRGDKILGVSRKDNPNDFGLIGGKVEDNETLPHALQREIYEETGLNIIKGKLVFTRFDDDVMSYTYVCDVEGEVKTNESGVVKEVTWEDLFNGSFGDYNRRLYKTLYNDYD